MRETVRVHLALFFCILQSGLLMSSEDSLGMRAQRRLGRVVKQLQPAGVAATADFLKEPEYCAEVQQRWNQYIAQFGGHIKEMLENEERYKNDYFVFYHAQMADNRLIVEFLKNLYEFINKTALRSDFEYLRFWQDGSAYADVNGYLDSFGIPNSFAPSSLLSDFGEDIRAVLVAVNPVLFGNFRWNFDCSFYYFLHNVSQYNFVVGALKKIFDYYAFDKKYISALSNINTEFKTSTGDIVQIFIPKKSVNDCAYLCGPWGVPRKDYILDKEGNPLAPNDYDARRKRYARCAGILDIIQNNMGIMNTHVLGGVQTIQLRLFLAKSGPLLNPGLGVKMFRFTTLTQPQLHDYKKRIRDASQHVFAGYGGGGMKKRIRDFPKKYRRKTKKSNIPLFISEQAQPTKSLAAHEEEEIKCLIDRLAEPKNLNQAVRHPDAIEWIKKLLASGADINAQDQGGFTALMHAIVAGRLDAVKFLVAPGDGIKGADIAIKNKSGHNALMLAALYERLDIIQYLIGLNSGIDTVGELFRFAATLQLLNVVKYLVKNGADVEMLDNNGTTLLMRAAVSGNLDFVRYLVEEAGANVHAKDTHGKTALQLAAEQGTFCKEIVSYLRLKESHAKRLLGRI